MNAITRELNERLLSDYQLKKLLEWNRLASRKDAVDSIRVECGTFAAEVVANREDCRRLTISPSCTASVGEVS